jgi:hypothetical protein
MTRKLALAAALVLAGCALFDSALQRLGVLGMKFAMTSVDVSGLVYPSNLLSSAVQIITRSPGALSGYGVDIRCQVKASNPNPHGALFDGGTGHLRVQNTGPSDPDVAGTIPAFSVGPRRDTTITVTFPLRLNSPVFSKTVWKKIVTGEDIPYKVDADLDFKFLSGTGNRIIDSLGTRKAHIDVVKSSVNTKHAGSSVVQRFLSLIDAVL